MKQEVTLIVARHTENDVRIISDTRFTFSGGKNGDLFGGGLKSIIVSPSCCICFAGTIDFAHQAIAPILRGSEWSPADILEHLLNRHIACDKQTDYLVDFADSAYGLRTVKDGRIGARLCAAWIGDLDAYNRYQKNYHSRSESQHSSIGINESLVIAGRMSDAFFEIVNSQRFPSIGGFQVRRLG